LEEVYLMYMKYNKKSYPELCDFVFGKKGYAAVCLAIFCFNFGGLCAQLMLFGTVVPDILTYFFWSTHSFHKKEPDPGWMLHLPSHQLFERHCKIYLHFLCVCHMYFYHNLLSRF